MYTTALLLLLLVALAFACVVWVLPFCRFLRRAEAVARLYPQVSSADHGALFEARREAAFLDHLQARGVKTLSIGSMISTADPALVRKLLLNRKHTVGRSWLYRAATYFLPSTDGILFLGDEQWERRHKAFRIVFSPENVGSFAPVFFAAAVSEIAAAAYKHGVIADASAVAVAAAAAASGTSIGSVPASTEALPSSSVGRAEAQFAAAIASIEGRLNAPDALRNLVDTHRVLALLRHHAASPPFFSVEHAAPDGARPCSCASCPRGGGSRSLALLDYAYEGPAPQACLLTLVRWIAIRSLATWGFGIPASSPPGEQSGVAESCPLQLAACYGRIADDYARTALERLNHNETLAAGGGGRGAASCCSFLARPWSWSIVAWARKYAHLWRLSRRLRNLLSSALLPAFALFPDSRQGGAAARGATSGSSGIDPSSPSGSFQRLSDEAASAERGPVAAAVTATTAAAGPGALGGDSSQSQASPQQEGQQQPTFLRAMSSLGFSVTEMTSEANHLNGAHKAVAFVTTCLLFRLSLPGNVQWRERLVEEYARNILSAGVGGDATAKVSCEAASNGANSRPCAPQSPHCAACVRAFLNARRGRIATMPQRSDLLKSPVFSAIWKETCRLHAVSLGTIRKTGEEIVDGDVTIPAGTDVQILLHTLHTHPEGWGANATTWDPSRWMGAEGAEPPSPLQAQASKAVAAGSFVPFLDGLRRCAGIYLAEFEAFCTTYAAVALYDIRVALKPTPAAAGRDAAAEAAVRVSSHGLATGPTHSAVVRSPTTGEYSLRLSPEMFTALDGYVPYTFGAV